MCQKLEPSLVVLPGGRNLKYWVVDSLGHWRKVPKGSGNSLFMRGTHLLCGPAITHHPTHYAYKSGAPAVGYNLQS